MTAVVPSWSMRIAWLVMAVLAGGALAVGAIVALLAFSGRSHVDARATSPDGRLDARAERQGGSMQFPSTSIYLRRHRGWFEPDAPDCLVVRWSAKGSGREHGIIRAVTLRWRDDDTLEIGADVTPPVSPGHPCGIRILTVGGGAS